MGFAAGFVSSIAGAGGLIALPILLSIGIPPINALATNKFQSVFGTLSSTINFFRNGHIDFARLYPALLCAGVGAAAGTVVVQHISGDFLQRLIPFLLIGIALYFWFSPRVDDHDSHPRLSSAHFNWSVGGGIGFYGGFFGPGIGSFFAFAFTSLLGYNLRRATAHTKPLVLMTNSTSLVIFLWSGQVIWSAALIMALGQIIGARLGSSLVIRRGAALVRPAIILATIAMATKLLLA
ncbi:TSUP family transporter [Sedimenticola sp.]|uniref:TSUP family transporter n=1 Tax=Sedimenticola sp. TaxID=1940285 RepID=UPI003D0C17F2